MHSFYPETIKCNIPVFMPPNPPPPSFKNIKGFLSLEDREFDEMKELDALHVEPKKYFLMTSAARWIKNTLRAVQAFDSVFEKGLATSYKVVVTGVTCKGIFTKGLKSSGNFVFLDYTDRGLQQILYKNQYAFVYPSLNEGFGTPPVESMQYGIPVAASGTSAIPETCGDAALYFDPYSVSEIRNRIMQLLDSGTYSEYAEKSRNRYKYIATRQEQDLTALAEYILK